MDYGSYPDNSIQFPAGGAAVLPDKTGTAASAAGSSAALPAGGRTAAPGRTGRRREASVGPRMGSGCARCRTASGTLPGGKVGKKRKLTRAAIRRQQAIRRLTALAMLLCVIGAGVYLTVTMLFKISSIQVRTADGVVQEAGGYTSDQILQALDVHLEENIFSFDPKAKAAALEKVFPMLEDIRVERDYPGTVVVQVTEAQPAWAMQTSSGWLTLSAGLKILAADKTQPSGLPTLYGGEPVSDQPGDVLSFETEAAASSAESAASDSAASDSAASGTAEPETDRRLESLNTLLAALDAAGMSGDVTRIEFADVDEMTFLYQDRISVWLGTLNELEYKLKLAKHVLLNEDGKGCAATDTGVLDFTHISMSSTRKFTFAQGEPELPSGYTVPAAADPDPSGEEDASSAPDEGTEAADDTTDTAADAAPEGGDHPRRGRNDRESDPDDPMRRAEQNETGTITGGRPLHAGAGQP